MERKHIGNLIFICIFLSLICLPGLFLNWKDGTVSETENRFLASKPSLLQENGEFNTEFIADTTAWLQDNIGFRSTAMKIHAYIMYNAFDKLSKADSYLGKDDWVYLTKSWIIENYQHKNLWSEEKVASLCTNLEKVSQWMNKKGIDLYFMQCFSKQSIYDEYYDENILQVTDISFAEQIQYYLEKNTTVKSVPLRNILLNEKENRRTYYKNYDYSHWNEYGAFIGYSQLMQTIKQDYPELRILLEDDFIFQTEEHHTTIYDVVEFTSLEETIQKKGDYTAYIDNSLLDGMNLSTQQGYLHYKNPSSSGPKALVVGDSFFNIWILKNFAESFSEVSYVSSENFSRVVELTNILNPDIVVFEIVEHNMSLQRDTLASASLFEEIDMENNLWNLPQAKTSTIFALDMFNDQYYDYGQISLESDKNQLLLKGWAVDELAGTNASNVYVKIGDEYFSGVYGLDRPDVADWLENENYCKVGFSITVPTEKIKNRDKIEFIVVSNDGTYSYLPIAVNVAN